MRILWIKTELLHPVDKGGRIRTYQMLRALSRRHRVTYLCLDDGSAAADALGRAREYAHEVVAVPHHPPAKGSPAFFLALLHNLFSPLPYAIARYRSPALRARVRELAAVADLVVCDFLTPSLNVPEGLPAPIVLFQHNVEATIWERYVAVAHHPLRRAYFRLQWRRMQRHEGAECRRFDHVIAVSALDASVIRSQYAVTSVGAVPTGVDLEYFSPAASAARGSDRSAPPRDGRTLVFVGSMDWMPNDDGIRWFASEVFGQVRQRMREVRLVVVGRSPSARLRELASRDGAIEVTGTVDDVRPYLDRAAIAVVPLRVAGGTRLKIYEAMAMGVPVVATAIGAEGLPLRNGEHLLIADTPAEQAQGICSLLADPARAARLAANALRHVQEHCSWDAVSARFIAQCPHRAPLHEPTCQQESA